MKKLIAACMALALGACAGHQRIETPEPVIKTVEVKVATPVPCPALAKLGAEPSYPDSDAAIGAAPDIFEASRLLSAGRLMRIKRLAEYGAAKVACVF